jgi:hypothetical protein
MSNSTDSDSGRSRGQHVREARDGRRPAPRRRSDLVLTDVKKTSLAGFEPAAVHVARLENARSGGDGEEPPAAAETEPWEGEGGATGRLRRPRRGERRAATQRV